MVLSAPEDGPAGGRVVSTAEAAGSSVEEKAGWRLHLVPTSSGLLRADRPRVAGRGAAEGQRARPTSGHLAC